MLETILITLDKIHTVHDIRNFVRVMKFNENSRISRMMADDMTAVEIVACFFPIVCEFCRRFLFFPEFFILHIDRIFSCQNFQTCAKQKWWDDFKLQNPNRGIFVCLLISCRVDYMQTFLSVTFILLILIVSC